MRELLAIQAGKVSSFLYAKAEAAPRGTFWDMAIWSVLEDYFYQLAWRLHGDGAIKGLYDHP
ncbi:hypothetical protein HOS13_gp12 [Caulobacter phage Lullwater]|uniref:Uncharacterized protein n=1 Tax=Caulobacter phage Lullwater TaxID=2024607 RepID=A0A291LC12_9CAUD|nr:hypothetical protein HOS13_gp12 [Caulobacter phage Lullwater]ATI16319.1 hypothetical protein Lull_012 [Caulobacter phage Lullwater]